MNKIKAYRIQFINTETVVKPAELVAYVKDMIRWCQITQDSINEFKDTHPRGLRTINEAIELLENDGYDVCVDEA